MNPPFDLRPPPNARTEHDFVTPEWKNLHDGASWEQPGGTYHRARHGVHGHGGGGGGHGGGHGGHGGGHGFGPFIYATDPYWDWPTDGPDPTLDPRHRRIPGVQGLDAGTGALLTMAAVWILYEYAGKRAR